MDKSIIPLDALHAIVDFLPITAFKDVNKYWRDYVHHKSARVIQSCMMRQPAYYNICAHTYGHASGIECIKRLCTPSCTTLQMACRFRSALARYYVELMFMDIIDTIHTNDANAIGVIGNYDIYHNMYHKVLTDVFSARARTFGFDYLSDLLTIFDPEYELTGVSTHIDTVYEVMIAIVNDATVLVNRWKYRDICRAITELSRSVYGGLTHTLIRRIEHV